MLQLQRREPVTSKLRQFGISGAQRAFENGKPVAMRQLREQIPAIAMPSERRDQRRQAGDVADGVGDDAAVEIGSEADVIFAEDPDQMVEMAQDRLQPAIRCSPPVRAQEKGREVEPHEAARFGDSGELSVGQVARAGADCMGVGMGGDQRRVGEAEKP